MPPRCIFAKVKLMLKNLPLSLQPSPIVRENPGGRICCLMGRRMIH
jgi:hypothetical protein